MPHEPKLVIFDDGCTLCRNLAAFASRLTPSHVTFQAHSEHARASHSTEDPLQLRLIVGDQELQGAEAWQSLIEEFDGLKRLDWLARQIGWKGKLASSLAFTGHAARRLCLSCRR